jgi:hypothetical protein
MNSRTCSRRKSGKPRLSKDYPAVSVSATAFPASGVQGKPRIGLYALNMLPISYAGLALLLLGITFLVVEIFNPTIVLGLGGLA